MQNSNVPTLRRSSRVPITVPILVTSLDPRANFSEVCETLVVSAHGCAMRAPMKLEAGVPVHFHNQEGRETTAQVVYCQPIESEPLSWRLGARFDQARKFLGVAGLLRKIGHECRRLSRETSLAMLVSTATSFRPIRLRPLQKSCSIESGSNSQTSISRGCLPNWFAH